jgi:hypothetical protein
MGGARSAAAGNAIPEPETNSEPETNLGSLNNGLTNKLINSIANDHVKRVVTDATDYFQEG